MAGAVCRRFADGRSRVTICNGRRPAIAAGPADVAPCRHGRGIHPVGRGRSRDPAAGRRPAAARGLPGDRGRGRPAGDPARRPGAARPGAARPHAAGRGRALDLPPPARRRPGADPHGDGQGRSRRPGGGARDRRRRLSGEALRPARTAGARPGAAAPRRRAAERAAAPPLRLRRAGDGHGRPPTGDRGRGARGADFGRIRPARLPRRAAAAGVEPRPAPRLDARPHGRPFDRTIDVTVSRLRRKLDQAVPGGAELVETVRNGGYLLAAEVVEG